MTTTAKEFEVHAEQMSALADGELEPSAVAGLCAVWRDDEAARERWHNYQLIGDVLRSEDLASTGARDGAFLSALRARLEMEPVVLAPAALLGNTMGSSASVNGAALPPVTADAGGRRQWRVAAVAAGFAMVVAGALSFNRGPLPADTIAESQPQTLPPAIVLAADGISDPSSNNFSRDAGTSNEPQALVANGTLIRDVRLDRYLAAHQQWSGGSVIGGHAAFLRHVAADAPKR